MSSESDIERLVRQVTDLVLARMGTDSSDSASARRQVRVLLPAPTENLTALVGLVANLEKSSYPTTTVVTAQVRTWLESMGSMASFPGHVQYAHEPWGELQYPLGAGSHVLVLGSLGFSFCRRLQELNDEDPMVWTVTRALLDKVPVLAIRDDLEPADGANGAVAQKAQSLLNDLGRMGLDVVAMDEAGPRIKAICAADVTLSRAYGQLLGEADVRELAASGHRKIVLAKGAIVTPLAKNTAAELGVELVESGR